MAPSPQAIFDALDATWPAARRLDHAGWTLRQGDGGGQRVSAATLSEAGADIAEAEAGMRAFGQRALFMVRPDEGVLDKALAERGYEIVDPVTIYAAPSAQLARPLHASKAMTAWPPLAIQIEIWAEAGIGPARIAIMERARCARTSILGRVSDRPAATIYVGADRGIAMLHALETRRTLRRQGAGRCLVAAAAQWAVDAGADWLTLAVVADNVPANALYKALGMVSVTSYHYRRLPEVAP